MEIRTLRRTNVNAILRLQKLATDPLTFTPRDVVSVKHAIKHDRVVGIIFNNKLIAYSILEEASDYDREVADMGDLTGKVFKFAGTVVHPDYRGQGIQAMMLDSHVSYAVEKADEFNGIMAYVHHTNTPSIRSIKKAGLMFYKSAFIATKVDYRDVYTLR